MKMGLMQPYFFPYAQQFRHIAQCDLWVVFDTVCYRRRTWTTRNRILNRDRGWSYITVPMDGAARGRRLCDARFVADPPPLAALLNRLAVYRGCAPFYRETCDLASKALADPGCAIAELNTRCIRAVCDALHIPARIVRLSELDLDLPERAEPDAWACLIAQALGASVYSNAPGGRDLYSPARYSEAGIALEFYEPSELRYDTGPFAFEPDLSVLDALMWLPRETLSAWVRR